LIIVDDSAKPHALQSHGQANITLSLQQRIVLLPILPSPLDDEVQTFKAMMMMKCKKKEKDWNVSRQGVESR
jgi:hypothetical protein